MATCRLEQCLSVLSSKKSGGAFAASAMSRKMRFDKRSMCS